MSKRYSGDLIIDIEYHDDDTYKGYVANRDGKKYRFTDLRAPAVGHGSGIAYDSQVAYDKMARAAVAFASYDDDDFVAYDQTPNGEPVISRRNPNARKGPRRGAR